MEASRTIQSSAPAATHPDIVRALWLARLLDDSIPIPGTSFRIGLDGLIGLIPGLGDAAGAISSSMIVYLSAKAGVPLSVLAKMVGNVVVDSIIGVVPILGDIFDFTFKANSRNARLLQQALGSSSPRPRSSTDVARLFGFAALSIAIALPLGIIALIVWFIRSIAG